MYTELLGLVVDKLLIILQPFYFRTSEVLFWVEG